MPAEGVCGDGGEGADLAADDDDSNGSNGRCGCSGARHPRDLEIFDVRDTPEGGAECTLQRCLPRGESCRAVEHEDAAREEGGVSGSVAVEECSRSQVVCLPYGGGGVLHVSS